MEDINIQMAVGIAPVLNSLYDAGVLAVHSQMGSMDEPEVQVREKLFRKAFPGERNLYPRNSGEYPWELRSFVNGIKVFALVERKKKNDKVVA